MFLQIPVLQRDASIRQVFTAVLRFLLDDIAEMKVYSANLDRHTHFERLYQIVENIDPNTLNIDALRQCLSEAGTIDSGAIERYIIGIRDQLWHYLKRTDANDFNALMIAAQQHSADTILILQAMSNLNQVQQVEILSQASRHFGANALMYAVERNPAAVILILRSMNNLSPDHQFEILSQVTTQGVNVLMSAANRRSDAAASILYAMNNLSPDHQFKILSHTLGGGNALMYASQYHPEAVGPILRTMNHLSQDDQFAILRQTSTSRGGNALMIAAQIHLDVVDAILQFMNHLSQEQQFIILGQAYISDGSNALMSAASCQPEAVASILRAMTNLSQDDQFAILSQVSTPRGGNALMIALQMHSAKALLILQAMDNLKPEQQFVILSQVSIPEGSNALMFAAKFHPEAAAPILQAINNLSPREKVQILLQSNDMGNSALEFLARHGKSGVNPALRLAHEAIDTIYNQDKTNPISTAASSSAASSSSDVTPVTSSHGFFSNSTTTNPPERIEQPLIDKLILAVEVAQKKYSNYVKIGNKKSSEFKRGNSPSPISSLLHNDTGSEKSLALSAIISKSSDVISIKKELFDFFNAKDTTYHAHSFVSYLIDELIRITPEVKIKPSTRYNKTMLTPLLDAIGSNPSKGTSGALDRDELESGHNTVVIG